jgi:hypothetical protein
VCLSKGGSIAKLNNDAQERTDEAGKRMHLILIGWKK